MKPVVPRPVLVTGVAGFIGARCAERLLDAGQQVVGIDNVNDYYDPKLKRDRLARLLGRPGFEFREFDLARREQTLKLFEQVKPRQALHLAAQAGVRYSLENPAAYIDANVVGFQNILDGCRAHPPEHLVYASSSSVYGANRKMPFAETDPIGHPVSLYAASKRANELQAHTYSHLFRLPTTGLRFFTVYGPWGRPDMALILFTRAILAGEPIKVFNAGRMGRDFTYIDDIVESILRLLPKPPAPNPHWNPEAPDPSTSTAPFRLFNIGRSQPVELDHVIRTLEAALGKAAVRIDLPMQPGDVVDTAADVSSLEAWTGFKPHVTVEDGIRRFVDWYRGYYRV